MASAVSLNNPTEGCHSAAAKFLSTRARWLHGKETRSRLGRPASPCMILVILQLKLPFKIIDVASFFPAFGHHVTGLLHLQLQN